MTTCICRVGSAYYSLLTTCLRQVAEVASIDEARSNGNIVISAVDPSKERAPDSPASTVSTASKLVKSAAADARYTVQQVMFDDMQSLAWKDRLVELKSESDGKLLTSSCRFFTSIFTLDKILVTKVSRPARPLSPPPVPPLKIAVPPIERKRFMFYKDLFKKRDFFLMKM